MGKQLELRGLWSQKNPDEEKILAKEKEISALKSQIQEKGTKYLLEARKVLTPEQQAKFGTEGFGFIHGMRGGFGPGPGMGSFGCPEC